MTQAFDKKNQEDFDENTRKLNAGLYTIETTPSLKATITELVKQTGLHRNTIRERGWPIGRINDIKELKKAQSEKVKADKKTAVDVLSDKLDKTLKTAGYWFDASEKKDEEIKQLKIELKRRIEEKEFWEKEAKKARSERDELKKEVERLRDLLRTMKD